MSQPDTAISCMLVVPAFDEERSIAHALDAVRADGLPQGFAWREWVVVDDGSNDGTAAVVRAWAEAHPGVPLRVAGDGLRVGKAARLEQVHRALVDAGHLDVICVGLDADAVPDPGAVAALLRPFAADAELAMTSGVDLPRRARRGMRASAFQRRVSARLARSLEAGVPRAVGRLYAYRVGAFCDFHWHDSGAVDDVQMAAYVHARGLRFLSVWDAVVRMVPAASWRDFYRQTYRPRMTQGEQAHTVPVPSGRARVHAFVRTGIVDPAGAVAYVVARAMALLMHRARPATFSPTWEISPSTKSFP